MIEQTIFGIEWLIDKEIETLESEISLVPETSVSTDLETSIKIYKLFLC